MQKLLDRVFSDKYVNHDAVVGNFLLLLMYRLAYPLAVLLDKLHLSPNQITTQSLLFSILAFIALVYDEGRAWFSIFWGLSVLLDFCDGTVARMTNKVSKTAFRYDHMSDIFKIALVVLGVGIRYDEMLYWILSAAFIFFYTYNEILYHDLKNVITRARHEEARRTANADVVSAVADSKSLLGVAIDPIPLMDGWARKITSAFVTMFALLTQFNGHTLLVFFAFPIGGWITIGALLYLIAITVNMSIPCINSLRRTHR